MSAPVEIVEDGVFFVVLSVKQRPSRATTRALAGAVLD